MAWRLGYKTVGDLEDDLPAEAIEEWIAAAIANGWVTHRERPKPAPSTFEIVAGLPTADPNHGRP